MIQEVKIKSSDTYTLIVYYSYEGNTEFIARTIPTVLDGDIIRLTPKKEMESRGLTKYFWGGIDFFKPKLKNIDENKQKAIKWADSLSGI
jgi:flavodoxin